MFYIIVKDFCIACQKLKSFLKNSGLSCKEINLSKDKISDELFEMMEKADSKKMEFCLKTEFNYFVKNNIDYKKLENNEIVALIKKYKLDILSMPIILKIENHKIINGIAGYDENMISKLITNNIANNYFFNFNKYLSEKYCCFYCKKEDLLKKINHYSKNSNNFSSLNNNMQTNKITNHQQNFTTSKNNNINKFNTTEDDEVLIPHFFKNKTQAKSSSINNFNNTQNKQFTKINQNNKLNKNNQFESYQKITPSTEEFIEVDFNKAEKHEEFIEVDFNKNNFKTENSNNNKTVFNKTQLQNNIFKKKYWYNNYDLTEEDIERQLEFEKSKK